MFALESLPISSFLYLGPAAPQQRWFISSACCTCLRLAPGRCGGRGKRRRRRVTGGRGVRPGERGEKGRLDFLYVLSGG